MHNLPRSRSIRGWDVYVGRMRQAGQAARHEAVRLIGKLHAPYFLRYGLAQIAKGVCPLGGN